MHKRLSISHPLGRIISLLLFVAWVYLMLSLGGYRVGWNLITDKWLTHSSEQYCYSLQYPGRWRLYTSGESGWHGGVRPYQRAMLSQPKPYFLGGITFRLDQVPMNQPDVEDVAMWSLMNRDEYKQGILPPMPPLESIVVNEQSALRRTFSDRVTEVYIAREFDGLILSITTRAKYHENASDTFQQLLNKFTYHNCPLITTE